MDRTAMTHEGLVTVFPFRTLQFLANQPAHWNSRLTGGALKPVSQFLWKPNCDCITHSDIVTHICATVLHYTEYSRDGSP